jgi:hypothetical protein
VPFGSIAIITITPIIWKLRFVPTIVSRTSPLTRSDAAIEPNIKISRVVTKPGTRKGSLRNGSNETLYFKDLLSGALLKSLVDRAKDTAIKRAIENPKTEQGLSKEDMQAAIDAEFSENEIFPKNDVVEDWLKLIDFDIENVVNVRPVKTTKGEAFVRKNIL